MGWFAILEFLSSFLASPPPRQYVIVLVGEEGMGGGGGGGTYLRIHVLVIHSFSRFFLLESQRERERDLKGGKKRKDIS